MTDIDHAAILRQHADTRRRGHSVNPDVLRAAADEIERLRAERDDARRMWCEAAPVDNCLSVDDMNRRARAEAERRGWGCFQEDNP